MLTLITGLPGNGKTLYALQSVHAQAQKEGRQVYYHGIKDLSPSLGWKPIPTTVESINGRVIGAPGSEDVEVPNWWLLPANAIFLIDEAQNVGFGSRTRGFNPIWSKNLTTHRHLGLDGYFITQDPGLIDAHDRKLMELHFHVMRTFGMQRATVHEFRPVRSNITSRKGSIEHKWKFPKEVFAWYTSAEAHTHKARIPMKVWVLGGLVVGLPLLCWFTWSKYLDPHRFKTSADLAGQPGAVAPIGAGPSAKAAKLTAREYVAEQQPRVEGLAYTAPAFDEVTKPVVAPYPAACVSTADRCKCYSQQATLLAVPDALCRGIVAGGFFVSWQLPLAQAQALREPRREDGTYAAAGSFGPSGGAAGPVAAVQTSSGGRGKALPPSPMR